MKFNALLGDARNVDIFSRIVQIVSKICKKRCVIRLSPDEFSFVNARNAREGFSLDFRISQKALFTSYTLEGASQATDMVFFEVPTDDLLYSTSMKESAVKLKLTQKNMIPHLVVELKTVCITHEIPITLILKRNWQDYDPPIVGIPSVGLFLPPVKVFHKIFSAIKNMGSKSIIFKANNNGDLCVNGAVDQAKMEVYIRDLVNFTIHGANSQEVAEDEQFFSVQMDLRVLFSFLSNLHVLFNRVALKIVHGRTAIFAGKEADCQFVFYINGLYDDD